MSVEVLPNGVNANAIGSFSEYLQEAAPEEGTPFSGVGPLGRRLPQRDPRARPCADVRR